jgi:hypothetical protein
MSISKPACSYWLERPVPNSRRPSEIRSSAAALGDADRMVELRRQQHDAVADADAFGPRRRSGEKDPRRGGVRELGEEVMLDRPHGVEPEPVGELDLLERFLVDTPLAALVVRLRGLQLVEQIEFHGERRRRTEGAFLCRPAQGRNLALGPRAARPQGARSAPSDLKTAAG